MIMETKDSVKTAKLKSGFEVKVFLLKQPIDGKRWANYNDGGKTLYHDSELKF